MRPLSLPAGLSSMTDQQKNPQRSGDCFFGASGNFDAVRLGWKGVHSLPFGTLPSNDQTST